MAINWSLLGPPVDIGAKFQEGYDRTERKMKEAAAERAFTAYAQDPTNPEAIGALARLSPQFAARVAAQKLAQSEASKAVARRRSYFQMPDRKAAVQEAYVNGDDQIAKLIADLDENGQKKLADMYKAIGSIAMGAKERPYEQRRAYLAASAPILRAHGMTDEQIAAYDPTDDVLDGTIRNALTVDQQLSKTMPVAPGGSVYTVDPVTKRVDALVQQNPGTGGAPSLPPVLSDEDILRLENGGPTAGPSGGFP